MNLKHILHQKTYNILRKYLIQSFTDNLGKIEETEEKIICHIDKKKIHKFKNDFFYEIDLHGLTYSDSKYKNLADKYNLEKTIEYIFENITFEDKMIISSNIGTHIIFKNCEFKDNIVFRWADKVTLENNKYYDNGCNNYKLGADTYLFHNKGMINKLTLINDNFINSKTDHHPTKFGINLILDTIEIISSNINIDNSIKFKDQEIVRNMGGILITAENTIINNSNIYCSYLYLDSKNIEIDQNSKIAAIAGVIIENKNNNENIISNIDTNYLVYNREEINEQKEPKEKEANKYLNKNNINSVILTNSRIRVVNVLQEIKEKIVKSNEERLIEVKRELESSPIKKVLKKS